MSENFKLESISIAPRSDGIIGQTKNIFGCSPKCELMVDDLKIYEALVLKWVMIIIIYLYYILYKG